MNPASELLRVALRHRISEPNIETAFARFRDLTPQQIDYQSFCDAVATCLRQGLIHEPVRLPDGALHCHWQLQLTADGVTAARHGREQSAC
jgi:hypothetical protein